MSTYSTNRDGSTFRSGFPLLNIWASQELINVSSLTLLSKMGERVLVPIDGSPLSYQALRHAINKFPDAKIIVFHVVNIFEPGYEIDGTALPKLLSGAGEWDAIEQEAVDHLFSEAEEIASELEQEITTDSDMGDPRRLIPEYARENDVDHIVIGEHGREETERSVVGQVAETVFFRAPVSVTVIR